ncbi:hypothetical protein [Paraburkholderia kururiensis]|uniref:Uncharacterized protein n=1 Tax=Paraburkholderia kururiensis TaxID=984307 RepID=A0ABZ0WT15_9BURK|nr:hypothetical protein [Paraburkholderia kururiensis]WQD80389.1 hypothetical protein U0042_12285 [Paraburkholderia kururiensis]
MKKVSLAILVSLSALTGAAYAQSDTGITMSTDPAKAADIEQRAQALQSQQPAEAAPAKPMRHHGPARHHKKAGKAAAASGASM